MTSKIYGLINQIADAYLACKRPVQVAAKLGTYLDVHGTQWLALPRVDEDTLYFFRLSRKDGSWRIEGPFLECDVPARLFQRYVEDDQKIERFLKETLDFWTGRAECPPY